MKFRLLAVTLVLSLLSSLYGQDVFKSSSLLGSGKWYKIRVDATDIYKVTYEDLYNLGFEAPENIRIYGQTGDQLSYTNSEEVVDDLYEIPLYSSDDNNFGSGDYYLFYGQGTETVSFNDGISMYQQHIHSYAPYNYYYITASFGPGKRINPDETISQTPTQNQSTYDWVDYYEEENLNLIQSGSNWYTLRFENEFNKSFTINNIDVSKPVTIRTSLAGRSGQFTSATVYANNSKLFSLAFSATNVNDHESTYAFNKTDQENIIASDNQIDVSISYSGTNTSDKIYLDYITLNARSKLVLNNSSLFFRDKESVGEGNYTKFSLNSASANHQVWDISDPYETFGYATSLESGVLSFVASTSYLREFVAVNIAGDFPSPLFKSETDGELKFVEKQNLHALVTPEYLIVTHPEFISQANELAQMHRDQDNMTVEVVTTTQVYNEFSSGKPDASAIRNLARMFWERSTTYDSLKYLLLFGDASYDNRTINDINPNLIPSYQSSESLSPTNSYVTDDFFGLLEPGMGGINGKLCIGVGRLPIDLSDGQEMAQKMVDKIKLYTSLETMNDSRNNMIFLGDDGESGWDSVIFVTDSDNLTKMIVGSAPEININKVYLDAYQQISSSTGDSYPEAKKALLDAFNKGALVFNYMGHGGSSGITQEQVLVKRDFEKMTNSPNFPLFVTATCQLSPFDNVAIDGKLYSRDISAGETALLNPKGGAIALFTTTRLVYQSSNRTLSQNLYKVMFDRDHKGDRYRFGDLIRLTKNATYGYSKVNTFKFALLGDPALTLPYGRKHVFVDSINKQDISGLNDTIKALTEVEVAGYIGNFDSTIIADFDGVLYANIFDKAYNVKSNGNDGRSPFEFEIQDKLLFRGKASVSNGRFSVKFMVPKDISYSFGTGKMSFYAANELNDAKGYYSSFIIGGTSNDPGMDTEGPQINLFINNSEFEDGGITDANPILYAQVSDISGINTTGNGIGHDIVAILDGTDLNSGEVHLLNDYYVGNLDDYTSGSLAYPFNDLEPGYHTFTLKVWDTYNNSSEQTIGFYVYDGGNAVITELISFPNPASTYTVFQYEHNQQDTEHELVIEILDLSGRVIQRLSRTQYENGFISEPLQWNFKSDGSLITPGVYPYRLTITTSEGLKGKQNGSLIIIP